MNLLGSASGDAHCRAPLQELFLFSIPFGGGGPRQDFDSGMQSGRANRSAFPPRCFSDYLCCLRLDANCLHIGCFGQFDLQKAIFQHRACLRAVNYRRQINDP